jgi:hypothetical protein
MTKFLHLIAVSCLILSLLACKKDKDEPQPAGGGEINYKQVLAGTTSKTWYWHQVSPRDEPVDEEFASFTMFPDGRVRYQNGREYRWDFFESFDDTLRASAGMPPLNFKKYLRHRDSTRNPHFIFFRGPIVQISDTMFLWESALSSNVNPQRRRYLTRPR